VGLASLGNGTVSMPLPHAAADKIEYINPVQSCKRTPFIQFYVLHSSDEGEVFQIKKSSHSKRVAKQLRKESRREKEEQERNDREDVPNDYSIESLKVKHLASSALFMRMRFSLLLEITG
jgi:hypothetical protein